MAKGMTAEEVADKILLGKLKAEREAYAKLRQKCVRAVEDMIETLNPEAEIDLTDEDALALNSITEEMRDLGYRFALVEIQDSSENIVAQKLRISVKHAQ